MFGKKDTPEFKATEGPTQAKIDAQAGSALEGQRTLGQQARTDALQQELASVDAKTAPGNHPWVEAAPAAAAAPAATSFKGMDMAGKVGAVGGVMSSVGEAMKSTQTPGPRDYVGQTPSIWRQS
jgi:hypothetical protein